MVFIIFIIPSNFFVWKDGWGVIVFFPLALDCLNTGSFLFLFIVLDKVWSGWDTRTGSSWTVQRIVFIIFILFFEFMEGCSSDYIAWRPSLNSRSVQFGWLGKINLLVVLAFVTPFLFALNFVVTLAAFSCLGAILFPVFHSPSMLRYTALDFCFSCQSTYGGWVMKERGGGEENCVGYTCYIASNQGSREILGVDIKKK